MTRVRRCTLLCNVPWEGHGTCVERGSWHEKLLARVSEGGVSLLLLRKKLLVLLHHHHHHLLLLLLLLVVVVLLLLHQRRYEFVLRRLWCRLLWHDMSQYAGDCVLLVFGLGGGGRGGGGCALNLQFFECEGMLILLFLSLMLMVCHHTKIFIDVCNGGRGGCLRRWRLGSVGAGTWTHCWPRAPPRGDIGGRGCTTALG